MPVDQNFLLNDFRGSLFDVLDTIATPGHLGNAQMETYYLVI
jgi:hypothetical protein